MPRAQRDRSLLAGWASLLQVERPDLLPKHRRSSCVPRGLRKSKGSRQTPPKWSSQSTPENQRGRLGDEHGAGGSAQLVDERVIGIKDCPGPSER